MREGTKYDFPKFWEERKKKKECPVCGKPKTEWAKNMRVYCCYEHSLKYFDHFIRWSDLRLETLRRDGCCRVCGIKSSLEVDHIVAIVNGGDEFDKNNLQVLCHLHHVKKTRQDMDRARNGNTTQTKILENKEEHL